MFSYYCVSCAAVPLRVQQQKKVFVLEPAAVPHRVQQRFHYFYQKVMYRLRFHTGNNSEKPYSASLPANRAGSAMYLFRLQQGGEEKKTDFFLICLFVHFW